ncbi:hypothetical protein COCON_G00006020 [Conger conger]|uniref:Uncharacterized protein n=1 Tax=Conger conger TaxID=82655 RepID=A0A9Q1E1L2_CONCO|nr:hypothetical protein COCON_G00006020 [Conger conger]
MDNCECKMQEDGTWKCQLSQAVAERARPPTCDPQWIIDGVVECLNTTCVQPAASDFCKRSVKYHADCPKISCTDDLVCSCIDSAAAGNDYQKVLIPHTCSHTRSPHPHPHPHPHPAFPQMEKETSSFSSGGVLPR